MIRTITVLTDTYNTDKNNPISFWPIQKFSSVDESLNPYRLPDDVLRLGTKLEFHEGNNLYVVTGRNGIGKTTFIKAIARSIANAQYFEKNQRTCRFNGSLGIPQVTDNSLTNLDQRVRDDNYWRKQWANVRKVKLPITLESASGLFPHTIEGTGGLLYTHDGTFPVLNQVLGFSSEKREDRKYVIEALKFYVTRDEIFATPNFEPYKHLSDEECRKRVAALIGTDVTNPRSDSNLYFGPVRISSSTHLNGLDNDFRLLFQTIGESEVYRRLSYLLELHQNIPQIPYPVNIFGEYELSLTVPVSEVSVKIFDPQLKSEADRISMGQYARRELEAIINSQDQNSLLLLDEPTANTDNANSRWFYDKFLAEVANKDNYIAFVATNDPKVLGKVKSLKGMTVDLNQKPARVKA